MPQKLLVTHQNPDLDAIGSIWLWKRFDIEHFEDALVYFVPAGSRIDVTQVKKLYIHEDDVVHVDTGGGPFDHHDDPGAQGSATLLVYNFLRQKYHELNGNKVLEKMVQFINGTDHFEAYFWPEPNHFRYNFMLEQILNGYKLGGQGQDRELLEFGLVCLDSVYSISHINEEAEREITDGVEFESKFGKSIGLLTSNDAAIKIAQKMGYQLVIRKDPDLGNIRIKAAPLEEIDLTPIWNMIRSRDTTGSWYFHPGKHMLLNGSKKNLGQKASPLTLEEVIDLIKNV